MTDILLRYEPYRFERKFNEKGYIEETVVHWYPSFLRSRERIYNPKTNKYDMVGKT